MFAVDLLGLGNDGDATDNWAWLQGVTALMLAAEKGHIEIILALLRNGAERDATNHQASSLYVYTLTLKLALIHLSRMHCLTDLAGDLSDTQL